MANSLHLDSIENISTFAQRILDSQTLRIQGLPHRLAEIEIYLWSAEHPDPFSHRNPIQQQPGKWYFHTQGGTYRGGTYKGLDITFSLNGSTECYGGILIRSLSLPDGSLLEGPCRIVDYILRITGHPSIVALVNTMASLDVTNSRNPIVLEESPASSARVYASPRVGLTLKRFSEDKPKYLMRPYRYLTDFRITKNKSLILLALLREGLSTSQIQQLTGASISLIQRYQSQLEAGRRGTRLPSEFTGNLSVNDLNYLYGHLTV